MKNIMKALYFIKDNKIIIDFNFLSGKIVKYDLISYARSLKTIYDELER